MSTLPAPETINLWLAQFEGLPLECDGMTRVISAALSHQGVAHRVCSGTLVSTAPGGTRIGHFWIALDEDWIIDLCARMWLGDAAPHGCFRLADAACGYELHLSESDVVHDPFVIWVLAGCDASEFEPFAQPAD